MCNLSTQHLVNLYLGHWFYVRWAKPFGVSRECVVLVLFYSLSTYGCASETGPVKVSLCVIISSSSGSSRGSSSSGSIVQQNTISQQAVAL